MLDSIPEPAKDVIIVTLSVVLLAVLILPGAWVRARRVAFWVALAWLAAVGCINHNG